MSQKESHRVYILTQTVNSHLTVLQAAQLLGLSERQVFRLKGRLKKDGVAGLAHKNRGRKPKHAVPQEVREKVALLASGPLKGASCEQMAEVLAERYGVSLSSKTIRRILRHAHIPIAHAHRASRRRKSRDRMPQAGLLVQCDASPFAWLEDRGPQLTLHGIIDDATGKVLGLYFCLHENRIDPHRLDIAPVLKWFLRLSQPSWAVSRFHNAAW